MTEQTTLSARISVTVNAPPERAFDTFTAGFATWWPLASHHIGEQDAVDVVIEPHAGGRWFERAADGMECEWGFVTAWEPPRRLVLAWHLGPDWDFDPNPARATEVEVTFEPDDDHTVVTLEHRGFEVLGDRAAEVHDSVSSPGGWVDLLDAYAAHVR
ncbi:MAG TPA: SRPBCC family protein [Solirubrobacteraceae bacterium]|jgi:uncharacterized protein YndB with AHSA1/START domain|nr:SRPBCC family protein [Solirubrobacteraceae bacterium]